MSFTKADFTDPQGITHELTYFEVSAANLNRSENKAYNNDAVRREESNTENVNGNLSYQMYFWPSEEARNANRPPYTLFNEDPVGEYFYINELGPEYDGLTPQACAELHCQTVVLA